MDVRTKLDRAYRRLAFWAGRVRELEREIKAVRKTPRSSGRRRTAGKGVRYAK